MDVNFIANYGEKFKSYIHNFATDEQIDSFIDAAGQNDEFKAMKTDLFDNIKENKGFRYVDDGEDKYLSALDYVNEVITFFEDDYANNMTDKYKNGKMDLRALGFDDEMFERHKDVLESFDLDGDIESFSAAELASYMLAFDGQDNLDGVITLDDLKSIDIDDLKRDSKSNYEKYV